ncbi:chemotaxis protein CheC [Magnetococcus sp. PR-3]|uniref:chemotaxis protein CheC n=1 Tax=Magnetococcus sp. PR-3 TaxID=3120355 RepID=UPI002FCE05EA
MVIQLNNAEQDALKELFNIGIGRAADALGEMVNDEVLLSVPEMAILPRSKAAGMLRDHAIGQVAAIRQQFKGDFAGSALLIYPETKSLELVRTLLGGEVPLENLTELEQESLLEVGNVILNACLGSFANIMNLELEFALPEYMKGHGEALLNLSAQMVGDIDEGCTGEDRVVFLIVDFITGDNTPLQNSIKGYVILLLDAEAVEDLKRMIDHMLQTI